MTDATEVYRTLAARLPHHAGAAVSGLLPARIGRVSEVDWVEARIREAGRMYRCDDLPVLGVLWWYSVSSVLVAPTVESLLVTGTALDPGRVTLFLTPDGRALAARSDAVCDEPGPALAGVIDRCAAAIAEVTGARERALWAIAGDSLANRALWAGHPGESAVALAAAIGPRLPVPRFASVAGQQVVRRNSCCLVYRATTAAKCASCPRQTPAERARRVREQLGG